LADRVEDTGASLLVVDESGGNTLGSEVTAEFYSATEL